jgi:hypothetical protein
MEQIESGLVNVKIVHFVLVFGILLLFSKLSFDALILGAIAVYLYQRYNND